jgi:hypothetical protein
LIPAEPDFENLPAEDLLRWQARLTAELRRRNITRSDNAPAGDLAEALFCRAFGWLQAPNSVKSYDATDPDGLRYQIKSRRDMGRAGNREVSALRGLDAAGFDVLAVVLFTPAYGIQRAALIPHKLVLQTARYRSHTNAYLFRATDAVLAHPEVTDVTDRLTEALRTL